MFVFDITRSNFNCSCCPVLFVLFKYDQVNKLKLGCISTTALVLVVCRCDRKVVWLVSYLLYGVIKSCMVVWPVGCMVRWRKVTPDKLPHSSDWQNTKKNYTRQFVTTHSIIYMSLPKLRTLPLTYEIHKYPSPHGRRSTAPYTAAVTTYRQTGQYCNSQPSFETRPPARPTFAMRRVP